MKPTSAKSYVKAITSSVQKNSPPITHGKGIEFIVKQRLRDNGFDIQDCGLFLDQQYPGITATPDGLLGNDTIVEIKCPYIGKDLEAVEAMKNKECRISKAFRFVEGKFTLNKNHEYYYQVQCQMQCTGRKQCLFVVGTTKTVHHEYVPRDQQFINKMMPLAKAFFDKHLASEVVILRLRKKQNFLLDATNEQNASIQEVKECVIDCEIEMNEVLSEKQSAALESVSDKYSQNVFIEETEEDSTMHDESSKNESKESCDANIEERPIDESAMECD